MKGILPSPVAERTIPSALIDGFASRAQIASIRYVAFPCNNRYDVFVTKSAPNAIESNARRGRPRNDHIHQLILNPAFNLAFEVGFRALSVESIAAKAGVGKTTIYRRWPNKGAVVMDAFLSIVGPKTIFPS